LIPDVLADAGGGVMPRRFGSLGVSLLALFASFAIVYELGTWFATTAEQPSATAEPSAAAAEPPPTVITVEIGVDTGRLNPNSAREPIPGGHVWLETRGGAELGGQSSSGSASPEGVQLCLQLPSNWRPAGSWNPKDQPGVFCQPVQEKQVVTVELRRQG
jgi:hypothetical protein